MLESAVIRDGVVRGRRNPLHSTLAERLKKARQAASLARAPLSLSAGLSINTVANIERGSIPGLDTIERLARALNLSPCYLAYGVEGDAPPPLADGALRSVGCGARVAQLREHRGLTRLAVGEASQTSDTTVRNAEEGRAVPSVAVLEQLAVALGCSPCWLAFGEGADPQQDPTRAAAEASAVKFRPPRKSPVPHRRTASRNRK